MQDLGSRLDAEVPRHVSPDAAAEVKRRRSLRDVHIEGATGEGYYSTPVASAYPRVRHDAGPISGDEFHAASDVGQMSASAGAAGTVAIRSEERRVGKE